MTRALRAAAAHWMHFWFSPSSVTDLALCRIVFFSALAVFYLPHDFAVWSTVSPSLRQPIWLFEWFHLPWLSTSLLTVVEITWKLSLFLSAVGLFTRTSMFVAAALGTYLLGLPHNFGQIYHFDAILVLAFWILAFSRAGDDRSIDAYRARGAMPTLALSAEYTWPLQLIRTALSLVFFAAGTAKLWTSGAEWFLSDHMAILLDRVQYHISDADPLVNWGSYIAQIPLLASVMAATSVTVETIYPVALFSRRLRAPIVLAGIGLILGIRVLMGPTFEHFLVINVFWVPWTRVLAHATERRTRRALAAARGGDVGPVPLEPARSAATITDALGQ